MVTPKHKMNSKCAHCRMSLPQTVLSSVSNTCLHKNLFDSSLPVSVEGFSCSDACSNFLAFHLIKNLQFMCLLSVNVNDVNQTTKFCDFFFSQTKLNSTKIYFNFSSLKFLVWLFLMVEHLWKGREIIDTSQFKLHL